MSRYTLYYLYKKQRSSDGTNWEDVMPNELSYDGDGTMDPVVVEQDSTECGHSCEQLQRWVDLPISDGYICSGTTMHTRQRLFLSDNCGLSYYPTNSYRIGSPYEENAAECGGAITMYRWTLDGFMCQGYDKYERYKRQVSYDNGGSWQDVEPVEYQRGSLIETNSEDCGYIEPIYRWIEDEGNTTCVKGDLYQMEKYQVSYDNGGSWTDVEPPQYRQGSLIEQESSQCAIYEWRDMDIDTNWICGNCDGTETTFPVYRKSFNTVLCSGSTLYAEYDVQKSDDYEKWEDSSKEYEEIAESLCKANGWQKLEGFIGCGECGDFNYILTTTEGVTYVEWSSNGAFPDTLPIEIIVFGDNVTPAYSKLRGSTSLAKVDMERTAQTKIPSNAFRGCSSLNEVKLPSTVQTIGENAFEDCSSLKEITLPDTLTSIENRAFYGCSSLTAITIPNSVTSIGSEAFDGCPSLKQVTIGRSVTEIKQHAFTSPNLESVTFLPETPPTLYATNFVYGQFPIYVPCGFTEAYKAGPIQWDGLVHKITEVEECQQTQYRWFPSGTTCNGRDLHNVEIYQMSTDGGNSWENVDPMETRIGSLVEEDSQQCVSNSYLESIDTSTIGKWVDLGFSLDDKTVVEVDMQVNGTVSSLGTILFGETNREPSNVNWRVVAYPDRLSLVFGTLTTDIDITPDQRFTLELTVTKMTISGQTVESGYSNYHDRVGNLVLFGDYAWNAGTNGGVRVYSIRATKDEKLIADLTPLCSDPPTMYNSLTMTPCKVNDGYRDSMTCNDTQ